MIVLNKVTIIIAFLICWLLADLGHANSHINAIMLNDLLLDNDKASYSQTFDYREKPSVIFPLFSNSTISNMRKLIQKYQAIVASGGWPTLPDREGMLKLGSNSLAVHLLRQRLMISGDLSRDAGLSDAFDTYVKLAVQKFQHRCGIVATGVVDEETRNALNVSAQFRLQQLRLNLRRILQKNALIQAQSRYVCVNIPALQIEAVENGKIIQYHKAVVGQIDRKTPVLDSNIYQVILNPYWTVPVSIVKKDLLPVLKRDPNYLINNKMLVYDLKGHQLNINNIDWDRVDATHLRFRQQPGHENAMSSTKINFLNNYNVYMHDTPEQEVFNSLFRFDSSGCVRVHNIRDLDVWLLKYTPNWPRARIQKVIASRKNYVINLKDRVGVHFVYITAWAQDDKTANFRDDVYGLDNLAAVN